LRVVEIPNNYGEKVRRYFQFLLALILPLVEASPLPAYPIRQAPDIITITPNLSGGCNERPTAVERYSRQLLHYDHSINNYSIIVQNYEVGTGCFEGYSPANVSLAAFPIDINSGKMGSTPLWTLDTHGARGELVHDFGPTEGLYRIDLPGCCAAIDTFDYVSLDTGKIVASATGPILEAVFRDKDNTTRWSPRLIAFEDANASFPLAKAESTTPAAATLFFSDYKEIKEAVSITGVGCDHRSTNVKMNFAGSDQSQIVTIESSSSKPHLSTILSLSFDCNEDHVELTLPVLPSGFDIANAKFKGTSDIHLAHVQVKSVPQID